MKKLLIAVFLLLSTFAFSQSFKEKIKGKIEFEGHILEKEIYFEADVYGIKIYDLDKKEYTAEKCTKKECDIIHLKIKNVYSISINSWMVNPNSSTIWVK